MILPSQRALFEIPDDVAYLNCAYMSPLMKEVVRAGEAGIRRKTKPWEIVPGDFFSESDALREAFGRLIGAEGQDVALVPAVSYGVSTAARNLPLGRGQKVLVVEEQFPSNVYPWRVRAKEVGAGVETIARPADGDWTAAVLEALDERTAVVALPQCHWTDGGLFDLKSIRKETEAVGACLAIDATQSAGAMPIDVRELRPDFLAGASYKWLMGPYSLGFLYVSRRWQDGVPLEHNWIHRRNAENFARLVDYEDRYQPGALRFDVGERSNFVLVPMARAGVEKILEWGVANIAETLGAMTRRIAEGARALELESTPGDRRAPHYLCLRLPAGLPDQAPGLLAERKVYASVRGASLRVTPHLYNTPEDVDRLLSALAAMVERLASRKISG